MDYGLIHKTTPETTRTQDNSYPGQLVPDNSYPRRLLFWVRVIMGASCFGYELPWVRVVLGTSCPGYELSWSRVFLGTGCLGHELSRSLWHSTEDDFTGNAQDVCLGYEFGNYSFNNTAAHSRGRWIKIRVLGWLTCRSTRPQTRELVWPSSGRSENGGDTFQWSGSLWRHILDLRHSSHGIHDGSGWVFLPVCEDLG